MSLLLGILTNNILPIFIAIGAGFGLARLTTLDKTTLAKVSFYIFAPSFVYSMLTEAQFQTDEVARIVLMAILNALISGALAWIVARLLGLGRTLTVALMLTAMFTNGGNYGLSLNSLAFGQEALQRAIVFFVSTSTMVSTLGIFLASSGKFTKKQALIALLKIPLIYAVAIAWLSLTTGIQLPQSIDTPVRLLGNASIPVMLILLGVQIAHVESIKQLKLASISSAIRLVVAPIVAFALVSILGLTGPARQATITQASMPTAVVVIVIAIEFDLEPAFVTSAVVLSTLLSPISLTVLIALLG